MSSSDHKEVVYDMVTGHDLVARELGFSRRAQAERLSLSSTLRLANRESRLRRRQDRLSARVHEAAVR